MRLAPKQLPIAVRFVREDLETATRMLLMGIDEHNVALTEEQKARLRRFIDDQGKTVGELDSQPFILPALTVEQGLALHRGERQIQVLFLGRGHTRGDVVVYLPRDKTVIAGDLLTYPTLHVGSSSRPVEWLDSLRALDRLEFENLVPGHGDVVRGRRYLELIIALLEQVVEHVQTGIDEGLKFAEIEPLMSLEEVYGQWVGDDRERGALFEEARQFVPDALGRIYLELTGRLD